MQAQLAPQEAASVSAGAAIAVCAACGQSIYRGTHFHTRKALHNQGAENICCSCAESTGFTCFSKYLDKPLALSRSHEVGYNRAENSGPRKGAANKKTGNTKLADPHGWEYGSKEEQDVSKTSQKNKEVQKAMKGKAEEKAKASKNGSKPKAEKIPYEFKPIAANFNGNVHKIQQNGKVVSPVHAVKDGKTTCGYSTTEPSKGDTHYSLNWEKTDNAVTCARCLKEAAEPKAKAEKKPTPIRSKKAKEPVAAE